MKIRVRLRLGKKRVVSAGRCDEDQATEAIVDSLMMAIGMMNELQPGVLEELRSRLLKSE